MLFLMSILAALLLAEIGLRLVGFSYPTFSRFTAELGDSLLPGAEGWHTKEGQAYIQINSDGLRDREHIVAKPPDTLRIAVLGDSYAEAMQVPMEKAFWSVLERELQTCEAIHGKTVETINFGVSGYGTAQELLTLRHKGWKYEPDIVLLAVVTGNDIRNNSKELQRGGRPYFVLRDQELVLDNSFMEKSSSRLRTSALGQLMYKILPHSHVMQLVVKARKSRRHRQEKKLLAPASEIEGQELGLDSVVYKEPDAPAWIDAWAVTEKLLRLLHSEVELQGTQLLITTLSSGIQVNPDARTRENFEEALGVKDLYYPDRRIETLARKQRIPFLMLAPHLREWAETNNKCVHGFPNSSPCSGHWNEDGHRLAGQLIAARICDDLVPEQKNHPQ